jgi:uncharacterized protein (TIGR02301 family)
MAMRVLPTLAALLMLSCAAFAQEETATQPPELVAPYDRQLLRLSEVLGSLHYLRALCEANEGNIWRNEMNRLITLEEPSPVRRARLIARFNRGFRALDETYTICTPAARIAADRYLQEGEKLSAGIVRRFGR